MGIHHFSRWLLLADSPVPFLSPAGADTVQGIWCSGGLAGGGECASLAGQRPQTLWHVVQGVCVQGEDTAALLIHMAITKQLFVISG